jgi:hypothetical protein
MSFSYDAAQIADSKKDQLRFLVQDTSEDCHFLENEEIEFIADDEPNLYRAASTLCSVIAGKLNLETDYNIGGLSFSGKEKADMLLKLVENYTLKAERNTVISADIFALNQSEAAFSTKLHFTEEK